MTALTGFSSQEAAMSFATANQNVAEYIRKCPKQLLDHSYLDLQYMVLQNNNNNI